jgi:phage host-nuclease inhibitor protein Gam
MLADQLMAKMNSELDEVRERYEEKLQTLRGNINIRRSALEEWGEKHKTLFEPKRSIEFDRGTIGFRTAPPKLKLLSKRTWDYVKDALQKAGFFAYTRTETTVAKDLIIADRATFDESLLKEVGIKIVQDEVFFCEVKKDDKIKAPDGNGKAA